MMNEFKPILMRKFDTNNLECKGLVKVLNMMPQQIIESVSKIKLIESGAYAENIADKWERISRLSNEQKKLIAGFNNIDNSYVSLCLLEKDPVNVLGGMAIAGKASNISTGILYLPEGKELLKEKLENQLNKINLFGFNIKIIIGKINVSEITESDLVHHIETLASISAYFELENEYIPSKIISVIGAVKKQATGEIPSDSNITTIINNIAGGFSEDAEIIVLGGETGKCITQLEAESTIFEGYGVNEVIVLNKKQCIVDFAKQGIVKMYERTCGKCTFCREGLYQLKQLICDATDGKGRAEDVDLIEEIANEISEESLCSLGQKSTEFVKTSFEVFKSDYESHIKRKRCPTGFCGGSQIIAIKGDVCDGCGDCMDVCDCDAIEGKNGYIHMIDEFNCSKCGKCIEVCKKSAIVKILGNKVVGPDKLTRVGRWKKRR